MPRSSAAAAGTTEAAIADRRLRRFWGAAVLLGLLSCGLPSCGQPSDNPPSSSPPPVSAGAGATVLATVNGHPITDADVRAAMARAGGHDVEETPKRVSNVLESLVRQELAAQRAATLGLTPPRAAQDKLRQMQAELDALRRRELSETFYLEEVTKKATVSDAEAQAWFAANEELVQTEIDVWQILRRDASRIAEAKARLDQGTPFEEVAREAFAGLPASVGRPWELGTLKWGQVPAAWEDALRTMKVGDVSGVITGSEGRYWIIKLVAKRRDDRLTLDQVKPIVIETLRARKVDTLKADVEAALRAEAEVVMTGAQMPAAVARPKEPEDL